MKEAAPGPGLAPPRLLAALSIALGVAFAVLVFRDLAARGPIETAPPGLVLRLAAVAVALNAGYVIAPLLIGRGLWRSFAAGLLLAPGVLGWLLMFWPRLFADPFLGLLGGLSGAVLLALYFYAFRHFAVEFADYRRRG
ncbi:MAG TPA: hypothetical protein VFO41_11265 [Alphaproteobacteria bacterium]|nr:hypothetical protein [Alphaproteobacteria bacterium]